MIRTGKPSISIFAAALFATAIVGSVWADMVYDDETSSQSASQVKTVITTTETVATDPVVAEAPKLQKASEKAREKRGFQESMNNELVIQKLEDRRLKDEEKLTSEINKRFTLEDEAPAGNAAPVMQEEKVVKPITEANDSYSMSDAPKAEKAAAAAPIVQDQVTVNQSSIAMSPAPVSTAQADAVESKSSGRKISVTPRGGISWLSDSNYFDFSSQYSVGAAIGFDASENFAVELGYTFSQYGVRVGSAAIGYSPMFQAQELRFNNNSFDATAKVYLTSREATIRPFVGGGLGYSMGYVNYDGTTQQYLPPFAREDYRLNQFQGILQGGAEFKVASNIWIGAMYRYSKPLSSSESQDGGIPMGAFYPYPGYYGYDPSKQLLRGTFRDSSVASFMLTTSFAF